MIFKTINADAKKLTEQLGLFTKSFRDIKKDFANGLGVKNSLFQTSISKTDYQSLQKFNSAIKVTNDGLTKSQRITKAWNENMTGCSIAAKRAGNDLVTGKKNIQDISKVMNTASMSTKALGVAINVMANVGFMLAITAITKVISELTHAQENAVQATKEATEIYKNELNSIADYKKRLSELHEELKSGNLSYEETKTKHTELMSIQDELIERFGTEKGAIESVTEAISGQVDALDELNEKAYRDWVAKANNKTFWNELLPWGKSGLDQAIDYMETEKTVSFSDMQNANLGKDIQAIQKEIDERIQDKYNLDKTFAMFSITGTPDEIKSQLEMIRQDYADISKEVFSSKGIDESLWKEYRKETFDSINEALLDLNQGLEKHQNTYRTYIEGLIKYDSEYSDEYANILQKRAELESAQLSGNEEDIQKAKQEFMDAINEGITASESNENIKKYFESLYPELQAEFSNWMFEFDLKANKENINDIANEIGEKYTATDLLDMFDDESAVIADSAFNSLIDKAIEYGICTDKSAEEVQKLIDLLVELGIVQGNVKDHTFNDKNPLLLSPSDTINQLNTQLKPAMDSLASAWQNIFTDDGFALNSIDIISTCDSIKSKLDELNKIEGVTVDYSAYERFIDVLNNSDSTADNVKESFNNLASSIAQAGLSGAEDFETLKAALEDLGVVNEELVAFDALISNTEALKEAGLDLANATDEQIAAFADERVSVENLMQAIDMLTFTKLASNAANMDTSTEVANLRTLAENAGYTGDVIKYLTELEDIYQGLTSGAIRSDDIPKKLQRAKELTALIQESASNIKYAPEIDYSSATRSAAAAGKEAGKSYADALKDELSNLNDVIGAIGDIIDNQIDLYNDQKDAAVEALEAEKEAAEEALEAQKALVQEQIDAKQAEIDKIKEAADARKDEIDLQQKQYELERLQNQRTILVYSEDEGMHYVQDTRAIRDAKEAVTQAQENIQIAGLEKEISGLEDVMDSLDKRIEQSNKYYDNLITQANNYWDNLIGGLENYKSRWDELAEIEEQANVLALLDQMGISTDDVLSMSETAFQRFQQSYLGLLGEMCIGNDQMINSLSRITGIDVGSLNRSLTTTKESIDALKDTNFSNLSNNFDNLAASAQNTASAINGSGGTASKASGSGSGNQNAASGSGNSLKSAINDQTKSAVEDLTTQKNLFSGDEGLTSDVQEVIDKIGGTSEGEGPGGASQGAEGDSNSLTSALRAQTEEALNEETGIPAQKQAWEELNLPLNQAQELITTISSTLEDLDGKTFTITLNVAGNGNSIPSSGIAGVYGGVLSAGNEDASDGSHSHGGGGKARFEGTAHIKGTANAKGNWGTKKSGKSLVGELGQELIVFPNGTFRTVGDYGAEFVNIPKGSIIFNHLQTKQLLDKGNITGRGKTNTAGTAYAGGAASTRSANTTDGAIITPDGHVLNPVRPGDPAWELQKAFEPLLMKIDGNLEYLAGNAMTAYHGQLEKMMNQLNTTNVANSRNIQPNVTIGDIHVTCPGVTSQQVAEQLGNALDIELDKKFSGFHNLTDQYSRIR